MRAIRHQTRPLSQLADIATGWSGTPGRDETGKERTIRFLSASDVRDDGSVEWAQLRAVAYFGGAERYRIAEGDVLVPLRSARFAAIVGRGVLDDVIVSSSWAIIRTHPGIEPEFLAWFLSHPVTQRIIQRQVQGTNIAFITTSVLKELEVPVPTIRLQQEIARLVQLERRMRALERQLVDARTQLLEAITMQAVREAIDHATAGDAP